MSTNILQHNKGMNAERERRERREKTQAKYENVNLELTHVIPLHVR